MNVFVLDNSYAMVEIYQNNFDILNIEVNIMNAKQNRRARKMLSKNEFDLIIMEENINEGDSGIELYQTEIKEKYPNVPVIFVSAQNEKEDIKVMSSEKAVTMLIKPFGSRKFQQTVDKAMKH